MVKKRTVVYKPPQGPPLVKTFTVTNTKYIQNKETGLLEGRKTVKSKGDEIKRQRVAKPFTLVKKSKTARGHLRQNRKDYDSGEFF